MNYIRRISKILLIKLFLEQTVEKNTCSFFSKNLALQFVKVFITIRHRCNKKLIKLCCNKQRKVVNYKGEKNLTFF